MQISVHMLNKNEYECGICVVDYYLVGAHFQEKVMGFPSPSKI